MKQTRLHGGRAHVVQTGKIVIALALAFGTAGAGAQGDPKHGEYLAKVGNCLSCHTQERKDAVPYAGGRALKTPFGVFYGPNITPDANSGLGRWSETDFIRAMRQGVSPDGGHYFPAFPYPSFSRATDADLRDLWAYLRTLPASNRPNQAHELNFPFGWRPLIAAWKWLFFKPEPFVPDAKRTAAVNRGAYLVEGLGHCGECHTPRNLLGAPNRERYLAGTKSGPEGKAVPNVTPARLKKWSDAELKDFLQTGIDPEGDVAGGAMGEVVSNSTKHLTPEDLAAIVAYLRSLPASGESAQ